MVKKNYILDAKQQLVKALDYLDSSYHKILKLSDDPKPRDQETLETHTWSE